MNPNNRDHRSDALSIGNFALALLAQPGKGKVMGVTSRGFFLLTQSNRVLFISTEPFLGPVHILLATLPEEVKAGLMSAEMEYSPDMINFPQISFQINLKNTKVWQPPELPKKIQTVHERYKQIKSITIELTQSGREATFLPLLQWLITPKRQEATTDTHPSIFIQKIIDLQFAVHENAPDEAALILDSFLGYGTGLTPSGDDFVWGFLAALNRWRAVLCPQIEVSQLNDVILPKAQKKTSFLSATLIECATHGWADANMLAALDLLFTGGESENDVIERILDYGNSSGVDAFAGMSVAIETVTN